LIGPAEIPDKPPERRRLSSLDARHEMDALLLILVWLGAGLRSCQYIANTSLWLDEIFLASNILHRSMLLTEPLIYNQVAAKGFRF